MNLNEYFKLHNKVAIAFSGGIDSAYLLFEAKKYAKEVKAYYVKSQFQPMFELNDAICFSKEKNVDIEVINIDILQFSNVRSNSEKRCYYCKKEIFRLISEKAKEDGFAEICDGTNASDSFIDRPGMKALEEMSILSPLKECDLTKERIRELSKSEGIRFWNKPSYSCLATRIPFGMEITDHLLNRTETAENYLFAIGMKDFRVRTVDDNAKIEIRDGNYKIVLENKDKIRNELGKYYSNVLFDLED